MDGWVRVLRPFNSISVISRRWKGEHERLCTMKRRLDSGRISPPAGFEPATPWSKVESAYRSATRTLLEEMKGCSNGPGHMTNMAAMPIYSKNLKNLLLWNQKADDLESWYVASGDRVLPSLFKWWPWLTQTYFTARSNLVPLCFGMGKGKTMDFSETIVVYDVKVDRCSQLNEYMNFFEYQRSLTFSSFFSLETASLIEANFHVEPPWDGEWKWVYKWFMSHDQDGHHAHIW